MVPLRGRRGRRAREGRPGLARGRLRAALERAPAVHRGDGGPRARRARGDRARAPGRRAARLHRPQRAGRHGRGLALRGPARDGGARRRRRARPVGGWTVAYQSRSGSPRDPWLEPDVADVIRALARDGARDVVVVPVGFVCDHVEVLYDLDVEAKAVAESCADRLPSRRRRQRSSRVRRDAGRPGPARAPRREAARRRRRAHRPRGRPPGGGAGPRARPAARADPARRVGSPGRHDPDGAPRRLPRRVRPRLVPLREAVGPRAVPPARRGRPPDRDRQPLPPRLRGFPRAAAPAPGRLPAAGAHPPPAVPGLVALLVARQAADGLRPDPAARRLRGREPRRVRAAAARTRGARARRPAAGRRHLHRRSRRAVARRHHAALPRDGAARAQRDPGPLAGRPPGPGGCTRGRAARAGRSS